jgi:hypothetical protein
VAQLTLQDAHLVKTIVNAHFERAAVPRSVCLA